MKKRLTLTLQADESSPEGKLLSHLREGALQDPRRSAWVALGAFWSAIAAQRRGEDPQLVQKLAAESIEELQVQIYRIATVCSFEANRAVVNFAALPLHAPDQQKGTSEVNILLGTNGAVLGKIDFDD